MNRRSARVVLLDENDRVLLIHFGVMRANGPFKFWAAPGGTIEYGEEPLAAALRETMEELGLEVQLSGPIFKEHSSFDHEGSMVDNVDLFFFGRCGSAEPKLHWATDAERRAMRELRWWSADDLEGSRETIFHPNLAARIRYALGNS